MRINFLLICSADRSPRETFSRDSPFSEALRIEDF